MLNEYDRPNPAQYLNRGVKGAERNRPLDFAEKYRAKPPYPPFISDRFDNADLASRLQTRKLTYNKRLGFFPEPVFPELGRFKRDKYDFETGVSDTVDNPFSQPGFNPEFPELYSFSPVIPPNKKVSNPMPTASNPDPKGFLAEMGLSRFEAMMAKPPSTEEQAKQMEDKNKDLNEDKQPSKDQASTIDK